MLSLTYRSLKLYFCSRSNVLLSMLGALIAFVLYLVFIKQGMVDQWQNMPAKLALLDNWLIGGVLSVTAITTTFSSLKQFVLDRESDSILTDVSYFKIQMSYVCASAIVGLLMQIMMAIVMMNYFANSDQVTFDLALLPQLIIIMLLATILSTAINLLILQFVKKKSVR